MADAFRPLTLLLGAVALWAVCVLVLAIAGLGSRFTAPAQTVPPPPIPNVALTRSKSRLGPMSDYLVVGERPLLNLDRRPSLQLAADGDAAAAELDVVLSSVLLTPHLRLAIFTDNKDASTRRVRVGEMIAGSNWRLVQLEARRALIEGPSGQRGLELRVFDGKGGEAPTPTVIDPNANAGTQGSAGEQSPGSKPSMPRTPSQTTITPTLATQAQPAPTAAAQTQDQQVESIRRRIEARRAQMRAEAAAAGANEK